MKKCNYHAFAALSGESTSCNQICSNTRIMQQRSTYTELTFILKMYIKTLHRIILAIHGISAVIDF